MTRCKKKLFVVDILDTLSRSIVKNTFHENYFISFLDGN